MRHLSTELSQKATYMAGISEGIRRSVHLTLNSNVFSDGRGFQRASGSGEATRSPGWWWFLRWFKPGAGSPGWSALATLGVLQPWLNLILDLCFPDIRVTRWHPVNISYIWVLPFGGNRKLFDWICTDCPTCGDLSKKKKHNRKHPFKETHFILKNYKKNPQKGVP